MADEVHDPMAIDEVELGQGEDAVAVERGRLGGSRRLFLTRLIALYDAGRLAFFGSLAPLADGDLPAAPFAK